MCPALRSVCPPPLTPPPNPLFHPPHLAAPHLPAGRLDAEVLLVTRRVGELLTKLPRDINPVNLEELRRIKQTLVELEDKVCLLLCGGGPI